MNPIHHYEDPAIETLKLREAEDIQQTQDNETRKKQSRLIDLRNKLKFILQPEYARVIDQFRAHPCDLEDTLTLRIGFALLFLFIALGCLTGGSILAYIAFAAMWYAFRHLLVFLAFAYGSAIFFIFHLTVETLCVTLRDGQKKLSKPFMAVLLTVALANMIALAFLIRGELHTPPASSSGISTSEQEDATAFERDAQLAEQSTGRIERHGGISEVLLTIILETVGGIALSASYSMLSVNLSGWKNHRRRRRLNKDIANTQSSIEKLELEIQNAFIRPHSRMNNHSDSSDSTSNASSHIGKTISGITAVLLAGMLMSGCASGCSSSSTPKVKSVVILVDLSLSTTKEQHAANAKDITNSLFSYTSPAIISIAGIASSGFEKPLVLVRESLPNDPKPLQPDFKRAKARLFRKWDKQAKSYSPFSKFSDVIGSLCWSALQLQGSISLDRSLTIFSNMRHCTRELNLEKTQATPINKIIDQLQKEKAIPNLSGVRVVIVWSPDNGMTPIHRDWLEKFWHAYFEEAKVKSLNIIESGTVTFQTSGAEL